MTRSIKLDSPKQQQPLPASLIDESIAARHYQMQMTPRKWIGAEKVVIGFGVFVLAIGRPRLSAGKLHPRVPSRNSTAKCPKFLPAIQLTDSGRPREEALRS